MPAAAAPSRRDPLGEGVSVAPLADFGSSKAYGLGVGARVGYTHASHIYFGGTFQYHFGGSSGPFRYAAFYLGPEIGYNVAAGPVVVRPYVGGGFGSLQTTYHGTGFMSAGGGQGVTDDFHGRSQSAFFWPGVTVLVPAGDDFALGADLRALFAPGQTAGVGALANNGTLTFPNAASSTPSSTAIVAGFTASYRF
jgi:hypothetical protein